MSYPTVLWRDRDFVRLWLAQSVSAFGGRITREGLPIAAVLTLGASPAQLGLLSALSHGPALIVGLAAGGFIDRNRRRGLMMAADLVRAAVLATIPVAALLHVLTLPSSMSPPPWSGPPASCSKSRITPTSPALWREGN